MHPWQIEHASTLEEATDQGVKRWFDDGLSLAPRDMAERGSSSVESVNFQQCRKDPSGAALRFVLDVVAAVDRNNVSSVIKDTDVCKSLI